MDLFFKEIVLTKMDFLIEIMFSMAESQYESHRKLLENVFLWTMDTKKKELFFRLSHTFLLSRQPSFHLRKTMKS